MICCQLRSICFVEKWLKITCPCCKREEEDVLHAIWTCPAARDLWGCQASCFNKYSYMGDTFQGLFVYSMERSSPGELDLMSMVARRIWLRRNAVVFEERFDHSNVVYARAISTLDDFTRCNSKEEDSATQGPNFQQQSRPTSWSPPPNGLVKVNWDATLNVERGWIGLGVIARDSEGFCYH
jgi:hypothetical protein